MLLLDNVTGEANIGSLFRLADAFGIEKIIFGGSRPNLNSNRLTRTARNTHKLVDFEFYEKSSEAIDTYRNMGYKSIGLEITSTSRPIHEISEKKLGETLLVAGNERHGISAEVLESIDELFHIEMFGENSSMNVAQSVGIALYEITKVFNKFDKK
ncbi:TrmH family RNA methyltransferase [Gramella sp. GC03-9]|uniref:TrmH family RNA methyltransferase n=1 Tax=Christiangramia oceanisediminis TaxID=2920386 RepID=A0A9X2KY90_9FLAO|nr:TrmH family RNA methyltransferase [Gramella oceanisediminis]MCP9200457.1 TrmH family RNA methyltransferase [Gramella oceanisediminis]